MESVKLTFNQEDFENINTCRKLRRLGKLDRITIDETEHRSGLNKHLFDYIEYAGLDLKSYIKQYLSNLQPFMIERKRNQEYDKGIICIIDKLYRVSVYIKADNTQFSEAIISFHENNINGIAKTNDVYVKNQHGYVPVFADSETSSLLDSDKYGIKVFIQRGLKTYPIELVGKKLKEDVYIVSERTIEQFLIDDCNTYIQDLYMSDLNLDFSQIDVFSALQQLSFTSYGNDTFSTLSLLIDSFAVQKDVISKCVADSAIVTFSQNLSLSNAQKKELLNLLKTKFMVTSMKRIHLLLDRIEDNLALNHPVAVEETIIDQDGESNDVMIIHKNETKR